MKVKALLCTLRGMERQCQKRWRSSEIRRQIEAHQGQLRSGPRASSNGNIKSTTTSPVTIRRQHVPLNRVWMQQGAVDPELHAIQRNTLKFVATCTQERERQKTGGGRSIVCFYMLQAANACEPRISLEIEPVMM